MNHRLDCQRARLIPVELERRKKVHIFDSFHMPARKHPEGGFGKGFDAHHAGQHGRAVDLMIVQERLNVWVERRLDGEAVVKAHACDLADHRPLRRQSLPVRGLYRGHDPARRWNPIHSVEFRDAGR